MFAGQQAEVTVDLDPPNGDWQSTDRALKGRDIFEDTWIAGGTACTTCRWERGIAALTDAVHHDERLQDEARNARDRLNGPQLLAALKASANQLQDEDLWLGIQKLMEDGTLAATHRKARISTARGFRLTYRIDWSDETFWVAKDAHSEWRGEPDHYAEWYDVAIDRAGTSWIVGGTFLARKAEADEAIVAVGGIQRAERVPAGLSLHGARHLRRPAGRVTKQAMLALLGHTLRVAGER